MVTPFLRGVVDVARAEVERVTGVSGISDSLVLKIVEHSPRALLQEDAKTPDEIINANGAVNAVLNYTLNTSQGLLSSSLPFTRQIAFLRTLGSVLRVLVDGPPPIPGVGILLDPGPMGTVRDINTSAAEGVKSARKVLGLKRDAVLDLLNGKSVDVETLYKMLKASINSVQGIFRVARLQLDKRIAEVELIGDKDAVTGLRASVADAAKTEGPYPVLQDYKAADEVATRVVAFGTRIRAALAMIKTTEVPLEENP